MKIILVRQSAVGVVLVVLVIAFFHCRLGRGGIVFHDFNLSFTIHYIQVVKVQLYTHVSKLYARGFLFFYFTFFILFYNRV